MPIKGLSDRRRLPRAGVIRLGIKKTSATSGKEYPAEVDYFVCPKIVQEAYGQKPKAMIIMFPVESEQVFFQQFFKCYGKGILLCRGDGETGTYWDFDKGDFQVRECPCPKLEKDECKPVGILQFLLPEVKESVGVWQISTSSKNSIVDINSGIDFVRGIAGRVSMIPLLLKREPQETHRIEGNDIKKGTHYTLKLSLGMSLVDIQRLGQIPPSQALIPRPDESLDVVDDLFPKNGFKPEEGEKEGASPTVDTEDVDVLRQKLGDIIQCYKELGGEITDKEAERIDGLEIDASEGQYRKAIDYFGKKLKKLEPDGSQELPY